MYLHKFDISQVHQCYPSTSLLFSHSNSSVMTVNYWPLLDAITCTRAVFISLPPIFFISYLMSSLLNLTKSQNRSFSCVQTQVELFLFITSFLLVFPNLYYKCSNIYISLSFICSSLLVAIGFVFFLYKGIGFMLVLSRRCICREFYIL